MPLDPYAFAQHSDGMGFVFTTVDSQPTLLGMLLEKYGEDHPDKRGNAEVAAFVAWAEAYLLKNPPASTFAADDTIGIVLQGGTRVTVSAGERLDVRGTMQNSPLSPDQAKNVAAKFAQAGAIPMRPRH